MIWQAAFDDGRQALMSQGTYVWIRQFVQHPPGKVASSPPIELRSLKTDAKSERVPQDIDQRDMAQDEPHLDGVNVLA